MTNSRSTQTAALPQGPLYPNRRSAQTAALAQRPLYPNSLSTHTAALPIEFGARRAWSRVMVSLCHCVSVVTLELRDYGRYPAAVLAVGFAEALFKLGVFETDHDEAADDGDQ